MQKLIVVLTLIAAPMVTAAPPDPWEIWDHRGDATLTVDHGAWNRLLKTYVAADPAGVNRVAYHALAGSAAGELEAYIESLTGIDPRILPRDEQMAYWINLYNAATVRVVTQKPRQTRHPAHGQEPSVVRPME